MDTVIGAYSFSEDGGGRLLARGSMMLVFVGTRLALGHGGLRRELGRSGFLVSSFCFHKAYFGDLEQVFNFPAIVRTDTRKQDLFSILYDEL